MMPQTHITLRETLHRGHRVRPFRPARWLPGPHLQTLAGKFFRPSSDTGLSRERWETPDGDFLDLDFGSDPGAAAPIVLVLHGLEGSTHRGYVRLAMAELRGREMWAVGLNFRSCSGEPNRMPRFYHSGETGDLDWVLGRLAERHPGRPLGAMGFSLGGNVLLRYLGERGEAGPELLSASAAISVPFDLTSGTRQLEVGAMGRLYTYYFLRSLRAKARAKRAILASVLELERLEAARTLREFDDIATAPLHGYADAWDYYRRASSGPVLDAIRVPTLLLHSLDDPFLPESAVPQTAAAANPYLLWNFPARGGHVGFVEGAVPWASRFWAEAEAARYLKRILDPDGEGQVR